LIDFNQAIRVYKHSSCKLAGAAREPMGVEACYNIIRVVPKKQMKVNIKNLVKYFYTAGGFPEQSESTEGS